LLILFLLAVGGIAAFAVSNLTSDDSSGGKRAPASGGAGGAALRIVEATAFDPPPGDGGEHSDAAPRVFDGDPGTAWETDRYSNRNFGNAKPGVGLSVRLDAPHDITSVTITSLEAGWNGQIYIADQPGNSLDDWGQPRATLDNIPAMHAFPVNGARGQYVLVWCTRLPPSNKLQIGDIKVEGR
jgi:hypothetical protein